MICRWTITTSCEQAQRKRRGARAPRQREDQGQGSGGMVVPGRGAARAVGESALVQSFFFVKVASNAPSCPCSGVMLRSQSPRPQLPISRPVLHDQALHA
eukprot:3731291-Rhodomonas_salina.2